MDSVGRGEYWALSGLSCASLNCDYKQETEIQVKPPQTVELQPLQGTAES